MRLFDIFKKKNTDTAMKAADTNIMNDNLAEIEAAKRAVNAVMKKTETLCARLELTEDKPTLFESKVGGMGYVPHDGIIPEDKMGRQLRLLAQIDCSQAAIEDFPESGLLQFWILNDDVYGMSFNDNTCQDTFRIVYYKDIDKTVTEEEVKAKFKKNEFDDVNSMPVFGEFGVKFTQNTDIMSDYDVRFKKLFCESYNECQPPEDIDSLNDLHIDVADEVPEYEKPNEYAFGHKIGGYPAFTQYDPRVEDTEHDFLLLQLDSDYGKGNDKIMWGDSGVCGFFINKKKLKNLDFSDVIYNWDCY